MSECALGSVMCVPCIATETINLVQGTVMYKLLVQQLSTHVEDEYSANVGAEHDAIDGLCVGVGRPMEQCECCYVLLVGQSRALNGLHGCLCAVKQADALLVCNNNPSPDGLASGMHLLKCMLGYVYI